MEKNEKKLADEICAAIAKQLRKPVAEVTVDKKLKEDLSADSLDLVELMMNLEEQYHITIVYHFVETGPRAIAHRRQKVHGINIVKRQVN